MTLPTCYRILDVPTDSSDIDVEAAGVEVGQYQSAYKALQDMKREFLRSKANPPNWYLLAPNNEILLRPLDLYDVEAS